MCINSCHLVVFVFFNVWSFPKPHLLIYYICVVHVNLSHLRNRVLHLFSPVLASEHDFFHFAIIIEKCIAPSNKDNFLSSIMWVGSYCLSELKIHNFSYTYIWIIII